MVSRAFIELGSNIEPERNLPRAVAALARLGELVGVSEVYETKAYGPAGQPDFLNAAVELHSEQSAAELRLSLRQLEDQLGRDRSDDRYAPRPIDLDLCLFDNLIAEREDLTLPHPDLLERAYLARSLADLAPDLEHPISGETMQALADRLAPQGRYRPRPDVRAGIEAELKQSQ